MCGSRLTVSPLLFFLKYVNNVIIIVIFIINILWVSSDTKQIMVWYVPIPMMGTVQEILTRGIPVTNPTSSLQPPCLTSNLFYVALSSWKSFFNILPLTVILTHVLLELQSVIHHHLIWFPHHQRDMTITVNRVLFITDPCKYWLYVL